MISTIMTYRHAIEGGGTSPEYRTLSTVFMPKPNIALLSCSIALHP